MEPRFNTWTTVFENGWVIQIVKKGVGGYLDEVKGKASKGMWDPEEIDRSARCRRSQAGDGRI